MLAFCCLTKKTIRNDFFLGLSKIGLTRGPFFLADVFFVLKINRQAAWPGRAVRRIEKR